MAKDLEEILRKIRDRRIVVWGDQILDEYIYTSTSRISREAPVLVTELISNRYRLGGAGNVVMNIRSLDAHPIPVGFIGRDDDATVLRGLLDQEGINTEHLLELDNYRTAKKSRILSGGENTKKQQVLRIDTLNRHRITASDYQRLEALLTNLLRPDDVLIISDYIFESVQPDLFAHVRGLFPSLTVIIDSRYHLTQFPGVTFATPNEPEIKRIFPNRQFAELSDFSRAGKELLERLSASGIVLKRGKDGMIVFEPEKEPRMINIHGGSDIVDVTGAGDTVIAVIGLAVSEGTDLFTAARLANVAAGLVVMKEGAYPIAHSDLEAALAAS